MDYAALAQTAGEVTSTGMNLIFAQKANERAREFDERMADKAWSKEYALFQEAQKYDSPVEQMKRLQEAGLNPRLMYQQGDPGQAPGLLKHQDVKGTFGLPPITLPDFYSMFQDARIKNEQVETMKLAREETQADIKLKAAELILKNWTGKLMPIQVQKALIDLMKDTATAPDFVKQMELKTSIDTEKAKQEGIKTKSDDLDLQQKPSDISFKNFDYKRQRSLFPFQLESLKLGNEKVRKEISKLLSDQNLTEWQRAWIQEKFLEYRQSGTNIDLNQFELRNLQKFMGKDAVTILQILGKLIPGIGAAMPK